MTTTIVTTVKAAGQGGDYTSLTAWEAGQQAIRADLVSRDEIAAAECYPFEDTSWTSINGFTADVARYPKIYTVMSARHLGAYTTSVYRRKISSGNISLSINVPYTKVYGLQFDGSASSADCIVILPADSYINIDSCIVATGHINVGENTRARIYNSIAYGVGEPFKGNGGTAGSARRPVIMHCTAISSAGTSRAFYVLGYASYINCLGYTPTPGNTAYYLGFASASYCASTGNETGRPNQTFTFKDAQNNDYRLADNDQGARGYGNLYSGPSLYDIAGRLRSPSPDIGAYQTSISTFNPLPSRK